MQTATENRLKRPRLILSIALIGWVLLSYGAAAMGAVFPPGDWYASLEKPTWNPPSWIFGPVWTVLYFLMGVSAWLVWSRRGWASDGLPLAWFLGQLALNALWTPLFFGLQNPGAALVCIVLLLIAIVGTIRAFWKAGEPTAAALLAPYLAWVSFATILNFTLWRMNA